MTTILIIEDERDLREGLQRKLSKEGYLVLTAEDGESGLEMAVSRQPALLVLDVMLPGIDGFEVCRRARQRGLTMPVIMLTAKSEEIDRVVGLEIGADDYVTKPFSVRELLARIRARLRERGGAPPPAPSTCRVGRVEVDFSRCQASRAGVEIVLTGKEIEILRLLARHRGEVVSRARLLTEVWGYSAEVTTRTLDTHILRLRQKVEEDPSSPRHILTVYGAGYRLLD